MKNDTTYQAYSMWFVKDVPPDNIRYLLRLFLDKAALNMGCELAEKTINGAAEIAKQYFSFIPVNYIASGIIKGSLGYYGAGRLAPRTVYGWLGEITLEYNRDQAKEKLKTNANDVSIALDLHKHPVGQAIIKKIEWHQTGLLKVADWDKINLKQLTEDIGNGKRVVFEDYK